MTFFESIQTCFRKYATFAGLASRSEFWWFTLFCVLTSAFLGIFSDKLSGAFGIATLLPSLAVGARRLHETDRSGWWQLIWLVPLIGWIVLIVFLVQEPRPNRYGAGGDVYV
ncbi:DUF805 domain-containing protein [Massilia sp. 9096]|uniref:DUF805 domain-containing protein n=1 Tax=Massilia sp. 9096 TaxID=1500894 RepID=UPI00055A1FE2|nr:DUF805 domain-containing protein [Massilia sp. 9096]